VYVSESMWHTYKFYSQMRTHITREGIIVLVTFCRNEVHEVEQNSYVKIAGVCSINE